MRINFKIDSVRYIVQIDDDGNRFINHNGEKLYLEESEEHINGVRKLQGLKPISETTTATTT